MNASHFALLLAGSLFACTSSPAGDAAESAEAPLTASIATRISALAEPGLAEDLGAAVGTNRLDGILEVTPDGTSEEVSLDALGSQSFLLTNASNGSGPELIFPAYRDDQVDDGHTLAKRIFDAMTGVVEKADSITTPTSTLEYAERRSAAGRVACISQGERGGAHRFHCIIRGISQLEQSLVPAK